MREVINIHVGQGGVQIANALWELFCVEHGIEANGRIKCDVNDTTFRTFFSETNVRQHVPRAVFVDLEPTVLDEIRSGVYRGLYHPDQLINGSEDAANNFARGHYTLGKTVIDSVLDRIRKLCDDCENLQGFFITHTLGGGTGSGFTALLLERLTTEFGKMSKIQSSIVPGPHLSTAIVEPYNLILNTHTTTECSDICIMQDNESIYDIFSSTLNMMRPNYININRLLAQVMSSLTVSLRYESSLNYDFNQMETNLVPFPKIHFPIINHAPILSTDRATHAQISATILTRAVFDRNSQLLRCDPARGSYMACCLQYRGDMTPKEVGTAVNIIKSSPEIRFVDWCPTGFKLGVCMQAPTYVPDSGIADTGRNVTMMSNTTAIGQTFQTLASKFDLMYSRRSFVHWFVGEGMEEGEFSEAREEMTCLIEDYLDLGTKDDLYDERETIPVEEVPSPPKSAPILPSDIKSIPGGLSSNIKQKSHISSDKSHRTVQRSSSGQKSKAETPSVSHRSREKVLIDDADTSVAQIPFDF